jgi:hypothetical protein
MHGIFCEVLICVFVEKVGEGITIVPILSDGRKQSRDRDRVLTIVYF